MRKWDTIPESEIERLGERLSYHIRDMNRISNSQTTLSKEERITFVKSLIKKQNGTCALSGGNPKYCWNRVQNKQLKYLKLEWGHKNPDMKGTPNDNLDNLYLLCGRCNNQLQTSLGLPELLKELEHKLSCIKLILEGETLTKEGIKEAK